MKTALVFPGQGSQFPGMGKDLFDRSEAAQALFHTADSVLGFEISKIMFEGSEEDLKRTSVTQPAIFIHSVVLATVMEMATQASMAAGHSLGEFSALTVAGVLRFEDALKLVSIRANAMQKACDLQASTMAAIVGLDDAVVEAVCAETGLIVVAANYNSPGQLVISGTVEGVQAAIELAKAKGAKMAVQLPVNGAFHSPLMEPAREELARGIMETNFGPALFPVYQNVTAVAETHPDRIRENLIAQLTAPVRWTQSVQQMIADGATDFVELGPGKVLQGLIKRIDRSVTVSGHQAVTA